MIFNEHSTITGKHAFLSPSNYHWINYDDQRLSARYIAAMAARRGTDLHLFAHEAIRLGIKLPRSQKTLNMYVNDGIAFGMSCEQPLYYSDNCFGHADTMSFRRRTLRVSDLKTGISATSEHQLEVYAALFCLEYAVDPFEIETELRIYQNNDVRVYLANPNDIQYIMDKIVDFDLQIEHLKREDLW